MPDLRTAVVVDYQNVHLVGHRPYDSTRLLARHATLIDPLLFANHLLLERNAAQRIGMAAAVLSRVEVFSGQPSPEARLRWLLAPAGTEGPMGGYLIDVILTRDPWMHRTDIAEATGAPLVLTAEHDGILVDDVVKEWAARHGQPCTLVLAGPAGGSWSFGTGGPRLQTDAVQFCRGLSGRGPAEGLLAIEVPF